MIAGRSIHELRDQARGFAARGDLESAKNALYAAVGHTVAREEEYVAALTDLANLLLRTNDARGALTLDWYAGDERTQRPLVPHVPPIDRARTLVAWAEASREDRARGLFAQAAEEYESAGLVAQAAIARERGGDAERARLLWSRLSQLLASRDTDLYAAALARFNLARTARRTGDEGAARAAFVASVHLLEQAADRYETIGQRERAFDCYEVLIAIGRESGQFEHVLEGYVNVIRILREDHLRYYALQSYEEAVAAAEKQGEMSAAATLAREMSLYARKEGLGPVATEGLLTQARLWQLVAEASAERGAPAEIGENALLAAVIAFGEAGQYAKVGDLYGKLARLELAASRTAHYERAAKRYVAATDLRVEASTLPAHLRHEMGFPDVWHVDLVEWEQRGSAAQACADVVLSKSAWSEGTRRRAMLARLTALSLEEMQRYAETRGPVDPARVMQTYVTLGEQLAQVELYSILSPLEQMFRRPEQPVRVSVVRALSRFLYKRSFITLRAALADPDPQVVAEAARALEELRFPHAFDPLSRIYRESPNLAARASALRALAKIDTTEAAELLLSVIEHDGDGPRGVVVEALRKARGSRFLDAARASLPRLSPSAQQAVKAVFEGRGIALR